MDTFLLNFKAREHVLMVGPFGAQCLLEGTCWPGAMLLLACQAWGCQIAVGRRISGGNGSYDPRFQLRGHYFRVVEQ